MYLQRVQEVQVRQNLIETICVGKKTAKTRVRYFSLAIRWLYWIWSSSWPSRLFEDQAYISKWYPIFIHRKWNNTDHFASDYDLRNFKMWPFPSWLQRFRIWEKLGSSTEKRDVKLVAAWNTWNFSLGFRWAEPNWTKINFWTFRLFHHQSLKDIFPGLKRLLQRSKVLIQWKFPYKHSKYC